MHVSIPDLLFLVVFVIIIVRAIPEYLREKAEERALNKRLRTLDELGYAAGRLGKSPDFYETELNAPRDSIDAMAVLAGWRRGWNKYWGLCRTT